jgi:hypothetical protein
VLTHQGGQAAATAMKCGVVSTWDPYAVQTAGQRLHDAPDDGRVLKTKDSLPAGGTPALATPLPCRQLAADQVRRFRH